MVLEIIERYVHHYVIEIRIFLLSRYISFHFTSTYLVHMQRVVPNQKCSNRLLCIYNLQFQNVLCNMLLMSESKCRIFLFDIFNFAKGMIICIVYYINLCNCIFLLVKMGRVRRLIAFYKKMASIHLT